MNEPTRILKVFLSHTREMAQYPKTKNFVQAAKDGVIEAGFLLDEMQFFPGTDSSPSDLDSQRLMNCDVYLGILGFKFGSPVRDSPDVSYTQEEFRTAHKAGKRLLVFLLDEEAEGLPAAAILDAENGTRQLAFRHEVQNLGGKGIVCQKFKNADELQRLVVRALQNLVPSSESSSPKATPATSSLYEAVLENYSERQVAFWHACLSGEYDKHDRLDHYVEPHYSLLNPKAQSFQSSDRLGRSPVESDEVMRGNGYEPVAEDGDDAETELARLLSKSDRLCLAEDAGAGKSVFTRRALAFACTPRGHQELFQSKPGLVVRWEQWENDWPTDFERALADAIEPDCHSLASPVSPEELVAWAMRQGRVLFILDGLDQVGSDAVIQSVARFLNGAGKNCRAIVTGRTYKVDQHRQTLFRDARWRFARIEGFDEQQIAEYLKGYDVDKLFPQRGDVAELLKIPSVLRIVRELVERGELETFHTRGELYLQASSHLILRAARLIDASFDERQVRRIEQILAAIAFEMMTRGLYGYAARGMDTVDQVERGASTRCANGISDREWTLIRNVTHLTNHCILEGSSQSTLSWQHRGMMEFYCGLHLARYATERCIHDSRSFASAGDWNWAWRFAIEMPGKVADEKTRTAALAGLYQRQESARRPNELIYRAWDLMESVKPPCEEFVRFQQEIKDLLAQGNLIAEQIENSFRPCPPDSARDSLTFLMGAPASDPDATDNEKPQVEMTVRPFLTSDCPTTNLQYGMYDPFYPHDPAISKEGRKYSPREECPVINVTWFDAWCFARWCGSRLPTEIEWEYACRAGTTTRYWWGDDLDKSKCTFREKQTTPANASHANPWGLMEMSGNVMEWCDTWYDRKLARVNDVEFVGEFRALRGGSFYDFNPHWLRSAYRNWYSPDIRYFIIGFRVSRTRIGF